MLEMLLFVLLLVALYELTQIAVLATRELSRPGDRPDELDAGAPGGRRPPGHVLASDAQRDRTTRVIGEAMAEGRLGIDEGIERIGAALVARHTRDLDALEEDLPQTPARKKEPISTSRT